MFIDANEEAKELPRNSMKKEKENVETIEEMKRQSTAHQGEDGLKYKMKTRER